ncbi:MAG: ATP-binding protein, partial [Actinomycetota bacterium]
ALLSRLRRLNAGLRQARDAAKASETRAVESREQLARSAEALREARDEAESANRAKSQFLAGMSHELRTPLTSLRTNVELLQRAEDLPTEQRRQIVDDAVEELGELSALVAELVDLATDGRRAAERWEPVELGSVVESVVDRFRRRRTGPIEVDLDDTVVDGNPVLIERAVSNLVDNATKWSEDDQPIAVEVRVGRVGVRDHGPGIDPAERPRVFDRFHRAPGSQDRPGSGLGLAIVHQIVQTHGGEVFVEDPPPGQPGIVVGFTLPVPDGDDAT